MLHGCVLASGDDLLTRHDRSDITPFTPASHEAALPAPTSHDPQSQHSRGSQQPVRRTHQVRTHYHSGSLQADENWDGHSCRAFNDCAKASTPPLAPWAPHSPPISRDDPSVDENTRLRNRIAKLESLVRELRGLSHTLLSLHRFHNDRACRKTPSAMGQNQLLR
jgi:hypothetical protein